MPLVLKAECGRGQVISPEAFELNSLLLTRCQTVSRSTVLLTGFLAARAKW